MTEDRNTKSVNILDVLIVIARHKWFLLKSVVGITIIALIVSLIWPETFKSTATILPPKEQQIGDGMIGGMLGNVVSRPAQTDKLDNEALLTLIRSRTVREKIIDEFNLHEVYGVQVREALLDRIADNTEIEEIREGGFGFNPVVAIRLSYIDRDPQLAKDVVDFYLHTVDSLAREINKMNIQERLNIIENRYEQNRNELAEAEQKLAEFQENYGLMQVEEQVEHTISQIGEVRASLVETKLQANVLAHQVGPNNAELVNLRRQQEELQREYDRMIQQSEGELNPDDIFHPFLDIPELALTYGRLLRDVEVQNAIHEVVYPQYQQQLMLLGDDSRNLQIMDEPRLPTYKDAPQRAFIVIAGFLFALFISLIVIYFREIMREDKPDDHGTRQKFMELADALKARRDT